MASGAIYYEAHLAMALVNLVSQIAIVGILWLGLRVRKKGKIKLHGQLMLVALSVMIFQIGFHMGPSIIGDVGVEIEQNPVGTVSIMGIVHSVLGSLAVLPALYIVGGWVIGWTFRPFCYGKQKIMKATAYLWVLALIVGLILFPFHWFIYPG